MENKQSGWTREVRVLLALLVGMGLLVGFDQYTKHLALAFLQPGRLVTICELPGLGKICILTLVWNTGAFLSLGAGTEGILHKLVMIILPGLAVTAMLAWLARPAAMMVFKKFVTPPALSLRIAVALFCTGGVGNLIDRIETGRVVDFLNFGIASLRTGIMNVADLYIAAGLVAALVFFLGQRRREAVKADN